MSFLAKTFSFFSAFLVGILGLIWLGATVTSAWVVTIDPAEYSALGDWVANMAQSFLTAAITLIPYLIPIIAVMMISGFIYGWLKRR